MSIQDIVVTNIMIVLVYKLKVKLAQLYWDFIRETQQKTFYYIIYYIYYLIIVYTLYYNIYLKLHVTTVSLPCVYHENNMSELRIVDLFLFYFSSII